MAKVDPTRRGSSDLLSTARQEVVERAVLTQILALHPAQLTILELAIKMDVGDRDLTSQDVVERAVRKLTRDGLLHCDCRRIRPTHAALRFDALLGGVI